MCLVVDVNRSDHLWQSGKGTLGEALALKLERGDVRIATGGKNLDEMITYKAGFARVVQELNRSGRLTIYNRRRIEAISDRLEAGGLLRSNDSHNLALAILSGAHVMLSNDNNLISDFRDLKIIPIRRNCRKTVLRGDACRQRMQRLPCCGCHP